MFEDRLRGQWPRTGLEDDGDEEEMPTIKSYALDMMYNTVKSILSSMGPGFSRYDSDTGEGSESFGQLLLDTDDLAEASDQDPYAVALLFAADGEAEADGGLSVISTVDGQEAYIEGWTITAMNGDAKGLLLSVMEQADGTYGGSARVRQGKTGELADAVNDVIVADTGTLEILIASCESNIEALEDDIYYEEQRLDVYETELIRKYANLESTLSTYTELEETLESLIVQLNE